MPKEKDPNEPIKVTDKRIFTADGEIREEFRNQVNPASPTAAERRPEPPPEAARPQEQASAPQPATGHSETKPVEKKRTMQDRGTNPGTPFTNFVETLIIQVYIALGMMRFPDQPRAQVDLEAARQLIDIITVLSDKTTGNLTLEESEFLQSHLGEIKLAYVRLGKTI